MPQVLSSVCMLLLLWWFLRLTFFHLEPMFLRHPYFCNFCLCGFEGFWQFGNNSSRRNRLYKLQLGEVFACIVDDELKMHHAPFGLVFLMLCPTRYVRKSSNSRCHTEGFFFLSKNLWERYFQDHLLVDLYGCYMVPLEKRSTWFGNLSWFLILF